MNDSPVVVNRAPAAADQNKVPRRRRVQRALPVERPAHRYLNAYAFDPSLSLQLENAALNQIKLKVPWEHDPLTGEDILGPGPVGEYLEVVDVDPASGCFYAPIDLNQPYLLASDGLHPSEGNPQFHQQMVYAVAMTTIKNFEAALGRPALWSTHYNPDAAGAKRDEYVRRLRIYPHAMREANAYYSPQKKALLFGYFPAPTSDVRFHLPGGMVFCCLSHDVVAHETTHALLDGMHRRFIEASNLDVLAFHEAFADICALF
ncbi:MAG: peptidase S8, partial [Bacteroidota bacterium]